MSNRIDVKCYTLRRREALAGEAIKPGLLVEEQSDETVDMYDTADGDAPLEFALENVMAGKGIDDNYAEGDTVEIMQAVPGDFVQIWLKSGTSYAKGALLAAAVGGELQAAGGSTKRIIGNLQAAVDATAATRRGIIRVY